MDSDPKKLLNKCLTTNEPLQASVNGEFQQLGTQTVNGKSGCLGYSDEQKILLCEAFCENYCYANSVASTSEPNWVTNTPRGSDSDYGVNITPGSKIFVTVEEGEVNFSGGTSPTAISPINTPTIKTLNFDGNSYPNSLTLPPTQIEAGSSFETSILSNYENTPILGTTSLVRSKILTKNLLIFSPNPNGYSEITPRVPLVPDPEAWKCLEGFPNDSTKIKCSFLDDSGEDIYNSGNPSLSNALSSRAFEVGTDGDTHKFTNYGGFIRFNGDRDNAITTPTNHSFPISIDGGGFDKFIDVKAKDMRSNARSDIRCNNFEITLSIIDKQDQNKIYYQAPNLLLSSSTYTTKNIPFYIDSKIVITRTGAGASQSFNDCGVSIKSQKYFDITMPNSGFIQFKMKDLESISYNDLKGGYESTNSSFQKNFMECSANSYITKFYVNKNTNNPVGIGMDCTTVTSPSTTRGVVYGGSAQYLGSLSGTLQEVQATNIGFSKIQIIKNSSNYIDEIKFFPFDQSNPTSIPNVNLNCTGSDCSELSCNGGKISGLKAQFDGSKIKALGVICLGNGVTGTFANENSCSIYGRIINPRGPKLVTSSPSSSAPTAGVLINDTISKQVYVNRSELEFTSTPSPQPNLSISLPSNYVVSDVYVGLDSYSNTNHDNLAQTGLCRAKLNILNCQIGLSAGSCTIPLGYKVCSPVNTCAPSTTDYSTLLPQDCNHSGSGQNGIIVNNIFGTGGGGGGNIEGVGGASDSSSGQAGESYFNPEFHGQEVVDNSELLASGIKLFNGGTEIITSQAIINNNYNEQTVSYTFPAGVNILTYKIRGGSGGNGGACLSIAGGIGGKGDSFAGTLDFTRALTLTQSRTLTFKIKIGRNGNDGKHCIDSPSTSQPVNPSQNTDTGKLKGGNGGSSVNDDLAGGGAGGSASYIALVRSDEVNDASREDFLVIAGGGGGGNGAKTTNAIAGEVTQTRTDQLKTNINGYRIGVILSSTSPSLTSGFSYDYYEYDDFITTTSTNSIDPLKKVDVNSQTYSPNNGIFVRKGQILRILPKTFEKLWNSKEGSKECGVGMIMKITPRPAALCLSGISKKIKNRECIAKFSTSSVTVSSGGGLSYTTPSSTSPIQEGCLENVDCGSSPILPSEVIPPSTNLFYCPDTACSIVTCYGGTEQAANSCTNTAPSAGSCTRTLSNSAGVPQSKFSDATCANCRSKKVTAGTMTPNIIIDEACYNFEEKNDISVHRFLANFDLLSDATAKNSLITNRGIVDVADFNENNNFGNFSNYESLNNNQYFKLKNNISVTKNGSFKGLILTKVKFKDLTLQSNIQNSSSTVTFSTKSTYSKGKGLQIYLCKETNDKSLDCNLENLLPSSIKTRYIDINPPNQDYFEFDSSGKIEKKLNYTDICDAYTSSPLDNFICFKTDLGNENEIKKYRLAFKIKDFHDNEYFNNSGSYKVKIEKRNAVTSRSGGIVNGVLKPIISNLDGEIDDPNTNENEAKPGIIKDFYLAIIQNGLYRWISSLTIVLALSFYGMGYLMGVNEMKSSEIIKILFKIAIIYLFTSTSSGWGWFNTFFVDFFKNAVDYITFSVAENFDRANASEISSRIASKNFYDKGILFKSVDSVIDLLLTGAVQKKILALLFSSIFGWIYFIILIHCLMLYIYAIANSMLLYITCQIITSILFVLGPIFFIFLMFNMTKDIFDNWIKALIGFSLQQIFLIMTLALFNSFVISFLKLALGYRVCWTNILSLNLVATKISILNFWTVAGINAPEGSSEESPDQSFGSDQNMPSLYLFLYLMIIVSLMKKFIELFTNLAVSLSGGLKASTIGSEANAIGQKAFKLASQVASSAYESTVGRAVANVDSILFDSGKIADQKRSEKRQEFVEDMKTKVSLMAEGNNAISKYKKENALEFSQLSGDQKRETLERVKMEAIKEYAKDNGIDDKKLDKLLNQSGLNYTGNNLFGAAYQAAKQSYSSGGNLVNSMNDKKVSTSFSKAEANSALKSMNEADQKKFIEKIQAGDAHVNKGKIEKFRSGAISAIKAPVKIASAVGYATLNPKTAMKNIASAAQSANPFKANEVKKEAIKQLKDSGKIDRFKTAIPLPSAVKNWARTDDEKKLIRDKMREISKENIKEKTTSKSVIKDLKTTVEYTKKLREKGELSKFELQVERFGSRIGNTLTPNDPKESTKDEKTMEQFKKLQDDSLKEISKLNSGKDALSKISEEVSKKIESKDEFKKFNILEKAQKSIETTGNVSKEIRDEITQTKNESLNKFIKNNDELNNAKRIAVRISDSTIGKGIGFVYKNTLGRFPAIPGKEMAKDAISSLTSKAAKNIRLEHVKNVIKEEISSNPDLKGLTDRRQEINQEITNINFRIGVLEKRSESPNTLDQAKQINEKNLETIKNYEDKDNKSLPYRIGLSAVSKLSSITLTRPLVKAVNSAISSVSGSKVSYPSLLEGFKDREKYKKALKSVKKFKKLKTPQDFSDFVKNNDNILK